MISGFHAHPHQSLYSFNPNLGHAGEKASGRVSLFESRLPRRERSLSGLWLPDRKGGERKRRWREPAST